MSSENLKQSYQNLYKFIFWSGYAATLIIAFLPIAGDLTKIRIGPKAFQIRLDHLLHIFAYFIICMYFLLGQRKGLHLFNTRPTDKFVLVTLILATVSEYVQLWVPTRAFNFYDWISNVAGMAIGLLVIRITR